VAVADQRAAVAGVFDRSAATYDRVGVDFFSVIGEQLVRDAALGPGQSVLDVGCGRGAVTFAAAETVGPTGSVTAIDLAPGMVRLTAEEARERGLVQVRAAVMDAQEPDLPDAGFDVVLSSLVLFFLPDPVAGLRAWRAAARDGGRLGFTTFTGQDDERWSWIEEVFPSRVQARTPATFHSTDRVHALLEEAGWTVPSSVEREHETRFADAEQWVRWSWSHGMRTAWERTPEDQREATRSRALAELAAMEQRYGELTLRTQVRYTTARTSAVAPLVS
jgi:ubiquinone/menaquinone biosynthesis C-methylase UbiE